MSAAPGFSGTGEPVRARVRVTGVVQGVGFRPFVHRLATELGLAGHVGNDESGVFVEAEGPPRAVDELVARLSLDAPALAEVESVRTARMPATGGSGFTIVPSRAVAAGSAAEVALVPPDTAVCAACLADLADPGNRRYRYPFTACTYCGPRFTLVRGVPYDRPFTTMAAFPLCPECAREYADPADRRFHAQPTACPRCGPRLRYRGDSGSAHDDAALAAALGVLREGGIVAVKGVGGYHLACDADQPEAVARLRRRKRRSAKPFAVMVRDLAEARRLAVLPDDVETALASAQAPIVLAAVSDSADARTVAAAVAPGNGQIGLMLPYSPLHHLLFAPHPDLPGWSPRVLVMTSGNLADEPLCVDPAEADERLAGVADAWLHHDRPIHVACDDSVVRVVDGGLLPVRRSRGYAPLPVRLPVELPPTLAVGGELKATVCLAEGRRGWVSQHLGDVGSLEALSLLERTVEVLGSLSRISPEVVVADLHPGYVSRRWARDHAASLGAQLVSVQHHHAHLGSLLAEHGLAPGRPVLGFTFDGTGYGTDGAIWGGEVLLGSYGGAQRVAHLSPVPLPGGDAAVRRPSRTALSHLRVAGVRWEPRLPPVAAAGEGELAAVASMLASGAGCVPTTSMGRLFDAVSALLGVCQESSYEGQPAAELEALAAACAPQPGSAYAFAVERAADGWVLDAGPVVRGCVRDLLAGRPAAAVAAGFHDGVADMVRALADQLRAESGVDVVGLTGGVFQNALLTSACRARLEQAGFEVLTHHVVPPNDGGLALGQAVVAGCGGGR